MSFRCPDLDEKDNKNNVFEPRCGAKIFEPFLYSFYNVNSEYLGYINKINDPTLKYVAIYLVQYYKEGYKYFGNSAGTHKGEACRYIIRWLHEKRDLFTYGMMCNKKLNLWKEKIESLWKILIEDTKYFDNEKKPWCNNTLISFKSTFPTNMIMPKCVESIYEEPKSVDPYTQPVQTNCICPESIDTANVPQIDRPPEKDPTKNLAVTSGFTAFGTLGTLLVLYKFTPMSSWFRRRGINNVGTDLYMGTGAADNFLRMQHDNGGNNLFYHSSIE